MTTTERHPDISFLIPRYPSLDHDVVGTSAVQGQLVKYPKLARSLDDPPIPGQQFVNLSYMLLEEPVDPETKKPWSQLSEEDRKKSKKVYGYVKFRGAWPTDESACRDAERLIKEVDSKFQVRVALAGQWIPITEDESKIRDKIDVMTAEEADKPALRDAALKKKRAEDERIQRELREHEEELKREANDTTPIEDLEKTLDGYVKKRVTSMKMLEMEEKYLYQLKALHYNMGRIAHELAVLERDHPDYAESWLDRYNIERRKYGAPDYVPSEKETDYHQRTTREANVAEPYPINNELRHAKMSFI